MNVLNWITNKKGFVVGAVVILASAVIGAVGKDVLCDSIHRPKSESDNGENDIPKETNGKEENANVEVEVIEKDNKD